MNFSRVIRGVVLRILVRHPKLMAALLGERPLRSVKHIYNETHNVKFEGTIPSKVYQTWTSEFLGRSHLKELEKFRARNKEFSFHFFDQDEMDRYMSDYYRHHPIYQVYCNAHYGPLKSDVWRYCILFERGGIYFDINK